MDADQSRLRPQARRLTTIAALARPVQHDINNLLTVVFANLELLKRTAAPGGPQRQVDRIQEAARRLEISTRALLSLARRPVDEPPKPLRLSDSIGAVRPLLALMLSNPGALTLELAADDPPVRIDRAAFEEALLLLAREVAEAQPRGVGLTLGLTNQPEGVELTATAPTEEPLPAFEALAAVAREAGGSAEASAGSLRLLLPPEQG